MIYANDVDRHACHWMRSLPEDLVRIDYVDERSITEVGGDEVSRYIQCHFFSGIGGWPYALRLAGWPDDVPVWTGSCPCQPFSAAGKRLGEADERHLWPEFRRLIAECHPPVIFGEQVASKAGREWLAGVRTDLEALGYAVGAADLCAAGAGAPHIRQRLFWVADAGGERLAGRSIESARQDGKPERPIGASDIRVAHATDGRSTRQKQGPRHWGSGDVELVPFRDGKARPVKPGVRLLAHGVPGRVAQLRGLGNAIVPQVAATFVRSFMEVVA